MWKMICSAFENSRLQINSAAFRIEQQIGAGGTDIEPGTLWAVTDKGRKIFEGSQRDCQEFVEAFGKLVRRFC